MKTKLIKEISPKVLMGVSGLFLGFPYFAAAAGVNSGFFQDLGKEFGAGGSNSPVGATNLGELITVILDLLLVASASIAVVFLIVGGYRYVVAHGNEEATEAAKKTITSSIVGLVIIAMSYAIVRIVAGILLSGTAGTGI